MCRSIFIITVVFFQVTIVSLAQIESVNLPEDLNGSPAFISDRGENRSTGQGILEAPINKTSLAEDAFGKLPLYFIENQGQMDEPVAYYVMGSDKTLYFTPQGVTFALSGKEGSSHERWTLKLDFLDANPLVVPRGEEKQEALFSYFKGNPEEWKTGVPAYSKLVYPDLWPGIDLVYSGTVNRLKYEFVVKPGADPGKIRLAYRGISELHINEWGELVISTPLGNIEDGKPVAYQPVDRKQKEVSMRYVLGANPEGDSFSFGFELGDYDPDIPLILDPAMLVYCGYIGGTNSDRSRDIALDDQDNAYVTGYTKTNDGSFPVKVGPDLTYNGDKDAFVAKVNPSGTALVYCGYIGGMDDDEGWGITIDGQGRACITGRTYSTESSFPATVGPDLSFNGESDAFIAQIDASGTALNYCGYIGGAGYDVGRNLAVDDQGYGYVTGQTGSPQSSFPVLVGPDLTINGDFDAFVAKVSPSGAALIYCGYIGGEDSDGGRGIGLDDQGNVVVSGSTGSDESTFPVIVGPDLTYNGGYNDAFLAKVDASGSTLIFCGYIGGDDQDLNLSLAMDKLENVYLAGFTASHENSFPVIIGPDLTFNGDVWDVFVAKVNPSGTSLIYCGYIGGSGNDEAYDIAVDGDGNAYLTGKTGSDETEGFPVSGGPDLTYNGGSSDAYVAKVNSTGSGLDYCGYIGGTLSEEGLGIGVDSVGVAYVSGYTTSTETHGFPVTGGPDLTFNGGSDAFVAKIKASATTWYVDEDATGTNDGSSWEDAFTLLQDALLLAKSGDEVWVAEGTYKPDKGGGQIPGDRLASFELKDHVNLYGGFDGTESSLDERDVEVNPTILSGDLLDNDGWAFHNYDENSTNVVSAGSTVVNGTLFDGFIVTGGYADNPYPGMSDDRGAGVLVTGGANGLLINNCTLTLNWANVGGAMALNKANATITDCRFIDNYAYYIGGGYFDDSRSGSIVELENCSFLGNSARNDGGAVYVDSLDSSPVFLNCLFSRNDVDRHGGGFYIFDGAKVTLINSTLCTNKAKSYGGGLYIYGTCSAVVTDCIFWDNSDKGGSDESGQIHNNGSLTIDYSCVKGWTGGYGGTGNIGADPLFVTGPKGFHYLSQVAAGQSSDSPCLDTGSDQASNVGMDALWTRTDEVPDSGTVDMGFHYGPFSSSWNVPLSVNPVVLSESQGGTVNYLLSAGTSNADRDYIMLGSVSGTIPGFPLPGGLTLPLNWDVFTVLTFRLGGTPILAGFQGQLDSLGRAHAQLNTYGPLPPGVAGIKMYFAYLLYNPYDFVSNSVMIEIVP